MQCYNFEELWEEFVEKQRSVFLKKKRRYLHFDSRLSFSKDVLRDKNKFNNLFSQLFKSTFKNTNKLFKKGFYPFIKVVSKTERYKKDKVTKTRTRIAKDRELYYASHFDSLRYSWFSNILNCYYENYISTLEFNPSVLAYRTFETKKSNIDFAYEVFDSIILKEECTVLAFDLKSFFDNINHEVLYNSWRKIVGQKEQLDDAHYKIYRNLTNYQFVTKESINEIFPDTSSIGIKREKICSDYEFQEIVRGTGLIMTNTGVKGFFKSENKGICQGSPISAVLSNISMIDFDSVITEFVNRIGGNYYRYSDDILIICSSKDVEEVKYQVKKRLDEVGLTLNDDKSEEFFFCKKGEKHSCINVKTGKEGKLQYLGFEFDGKQVFIRSSSISKTAIRRKKAVKKVLKIAFGKKSKSGVIFKNKLLKRFTKRGKSNFVTYARLAGVVKRNNPSIQKQYSSFNKLLSKDIENELIRREKQIRKKNIKLLEEALRKTL